MRLTPLGRDFLGSVMVVLATGVLAQSGLVLSLGMALAFSALLSLSLAAVKRRSAFRLIVEDSSLRVFKGETGSCTLRLPGMSDPWVSLRVRGMRVGGRTETTFEFLPDGKIRLGLRPGVAGRYRGGTIALQIVDPLKLFVFSLNAAPLDLVLDSLPRSLLVPLRNPFVTPLVLGEEPGRWPGKGQEFYGVEEYTFRSESKDILWKRAAKSPWRPLISRVRESNIPERIRICVEGGSSGQDEAMTDLMCEALGALGRAVLSIGAEVEVFTGRSGSNLAADERALAESILSASESWSNPTVAGQTGASFDLLVTAEGPEAAGGLVGVVPTLYLGWGGRLPRGSFRFTGTEDLVHVVEMVVAA